MTEPEILEVEEETDEDYNGFDDGHDAYEWALECRQED